MEESDEFEVQQILALGYQIKGENSKSALILKYLTSFQERRFGIFHPACWAAYRDYGKVLVKLGRWKEAIELWEVVMEKKKSAQGQAFILKPMLEIVKHL